MENNTDLKNKIAAETKLNKLILALDEFGGTDFSAANETTLNNAKNMLESILSVVNLGLKKHKENVLKEKGWIKYTDQKPKLYQTILVHNVVDDDKDALALYDNADVYTSKDALCPIYDVILLTPIKFKSDDPSDLGEANEFMPKLYQDLNTFWWRTITVDEIKQMKKDKFDFSIVNYNYKK